MSLKANMIAVIFHPIPDAGFYSLKLETENYQSVLQALQQPCDQAFAGNPMDYFFSIRFLTDSMSAMTLRSGVRLIYDSCYLYCFAGFAWLGFVCDSLTNEIGIRKVLGSSVPGIIMLLSKGFDATSFHCHYSSLSVGMVDDGPMVAVVSVQDDDRCMAFLISGLLVLIIAFGSVASQALLGAMAKPVEALKHE